MSHLGFVHPQLQNLQFAIKNPSPRGKELREVFELADADENGKISPQADGARTARVRVGGETGRYTGAKTYREWGNDME